ncbi:MULTISPECIES: hypothetical protein [unclassified Arthrobacter]|uniref:hypothetical protein n=1 Tax=unclassified Arthrobacter TaxID=235627 RepID=UPI002E09AC07|nr:MULTISPECIES: hypothetical protein [unclassified Arthrobacter]MEC5192671.1 hypothetical protein [Arthrobacter sp. MP_M4]MEC5204155.1 hypothetical protein [Arthrobacter sp. MP_M7]
MVGVVAEDQDSDGVSVGFTADYVVDQGDVKVEFAGVFWRASSAPLLDAAEKFPENTVDCLSQQN